MFDKLFGPEKFNFDANKQAQDDNNKLRKAAAVADELGSLVKQAANEPKGKQPISFEFLAKDAFIKDEMLKLAGLQLTDATPEGIDMFLKNYMYNELSFFPDKIDISVDLFPMDEMPAGAPTQQEIAVINATGNINLFYSNVILQIPFMIRDKEVMPFDTLQLGTERAIYTRENLRNVLINLKERMSTQTLTSTPYAAVPNISGFQGVEQNPQDNALADNGFMAELLRIRSTLGNQSSAENFGVYSAYVEELLEKTAGISKVNIDYRKLKDELLADYTDKAEKIANEEFVEDEELKLQKEALFSELDATEFADVGILKNSTKFVFTEKDGKVLGKTPGIIFKTLVGIGGPSNKTMVVTNDGRYKLLDAGQRFLYNANADPIPFELPTTTIDGLNPGETVSISINGAHSLPMVVTKVVDGTRQALQVTKFVYCYDVTGTECVMIAVSNVSDNQMVFQSKKSVIERVAQYEQAAKLTFYNMYLKAKVPTLCISPNTTFIKLKPGEIGNISFSSELMLAYDDNVKLASLTDTIHVRKTSDSDQVKYSIAINWFDNKYKGNKTTTLNNITEPKLQSVLKLIGYDYPKMSEIVYRAKKGDVVESPILQGMTPWAVRPELTASMAVDKTVKDMKKSLFSGDNASKALSAITGGILAGADILGSGLSSFASESAALAEKLEKIAIAGHNTTFTKLAGLMVIKNRIDNMVKEASEGAEFKGHEVLAELEKLDPYMSKVARDLIELKVAQFVNNTEIVSPNVINATLRHLDGLHKYACFFKEAGLLGDSEESKYQTNKSVLDSARSTQLGPAQDLVQPSGKPMIPGAGAAAELAASPAALPAMVIGKKLFKK